MRTHYCKKIMAVLIIGVFIMQLIPARPAMAAVFDQNAYYNDIGTKLEYWANKYNIPPVLLKAIAQQESSWRQYELDATTKQPLTDKPLIGYDGIGIGIMQISSYNSTDTVTINRLKNDIDYNIEVGCQILNQKWRAFPKIGNGDRNVLENWYFAVWGYNSWAARNNPNFFTGDDAYQDKVFSWMGQQYNSAITFAPIATKLSLSLLPPVNPPSLQSIWRTATPTHTGDLVIDANQLISAGGGPGTEAANGDYWYNYARWGSYYALGFYITAYDSPLVADKKVVTQKILSSYTNLLAEADGLVVGVNPSYATAAKYYWTVLQGPSLDLVITKRAETGVASALGKLMAEADALAIKGTGDSIVSAVQDYCIVLQGAVPNLYPQITNQAKTGLLSAYGKLLAEADKLAAERTPSSYTSAAKYYLTVLQGPILDASLTERAKIGYQNAINPPVTINRLAGIRAEDTAIEISKEGWADNSSPDILLARVDSFQDALAAAPLAKKLKAPLLLTAPGQLDSAVLQEVKRLGGRNVYIIGGEGAIKKAVADSLIGANLTVDRTLFGVTAADTAVAIARRIGPTTQVILASSTSFPDALSASAPAAAMGIPILLTEQATLPESTKQLLKDFKVTKTIIVGGDYVISKAFDEGGVLASYGPQRLAGNTEYDTMLQIVKYFNQDTKSIVIATGENFPDGLAGGSFAALSGSPMILIPNGDVNPDTQAYLKSLRGKTIKAYILGGTGAISNTNEKLVGSLLTPQ